MIYIYIFIIALFNSPSTSSKKEAIVFKRDQTIMLEASAIKWLKAEAKPAWQLEIEGISNVLKIKRPFSFYKGKVGNSKLIFIVKGAKFKKIKLTPEMILKIFGIETEEEPDAFETMDLVGTNGETDIAFCSCGGATIEKDGDHCFLYEVSGFIECDGACSGESSDKECGMTVVDFTPGISPRKIRMN